MSDSIPSTVFVVDSDYFSRHRLCDVIRSFGWFAVSYVPQQLIVGAVPALVADCILLDIDLPDGDGLLALEAARRHRNHTPAVLLAAYPEAIPPARAYMAGAYATVRKPVERNELRARLTEIIATYPAPTVCSPEAIDQNQG